MWKRASEWVSERARWEREKYVQSFCSQAFHLKNDKGLNFVYDKNVDAVDYVASSKWLYF